MKTENNANTVNVSGQIEVVAVSSATRRMKKVAIWGTAIAAVAAAGYYGYKFYQKGKTVIEVVISEDATPADEAAAEPAAN